MKESLIRATDLALKMVSDQRFYQTERGFQGRFYCALQAQLERANLITNGAILEMEYQKSARHGIGQRPDIVFHIPMEHSNLTVRDNNFAVWALKRMASQQEAQEDFIKLDQIVEALNYSFTFFININTNNNMYNYYQGSYRDRLITVATHLTESKVEVCWSNAE